MGNPKSIKSCRYITCNVTNYVNNFLFMILHLYVNSKLRKNIFANNFSIVKL